MRLPLVALLASLAGVGVSTYLTAVHYIGVPLACPTTAQISCEAVLSSGYAVIAGTSMPTSAAGIVWFGVSAVLWLRGPAQLRLAWAAVGLVAVAGLVYIEIVVLGAICLWCTVAHLLVLAIAAITVTGPAMGRDAQATR